MVNLKSSLSFGRSKIQLVIWPIIKNQVTFFKKSLAFRGHTVNKRGRSNRKFELSDLDLRIARIDPSRQVSMDEPRENEDELTGIANIAF